MDESLEDPTITSVRLVTNPEKTVLRETQRVFVYFSLHELTIDSVIVNRVLPPEVRDTWFDEWRDAQGKLLHEIEEYFAPIAVRQVPLFAHEVLGSARLEEVAKVLYAEGEDLAAVKRTEKPYSFAKQNGVYEVRVLLPFATNGEIGLLKKGDELAINRAARGCVGGYAISIKSRGRAYKRFPEASLNTVLGLVSLPRRTASLLWANA